MRSNAPSRLALLLAATAALASTARAQLAQATQGLERYGPISKVHGYPEWYQDKTGLALELLTPKSNAELDGGWDVLIRGLGQPGTAQFTTFPEAFPYPWFIEHFYWGAVADIAAPLCRLELALEATFGNGFNVVAGDQVAFTRIRFRMDQPPLNGDYLIETPYSTHEVKGVVAGVRLRLVEDIGIGPAPAGFAGALNSKIGPFLTASATPGGAELPLVTGPAPEVPYTGPAPVFLASPARIGPVTGSPLGATRNALKIYVKTAGMTAYPTTPNWQQVNFTLNGRVKTDAAPSRTTVVRANRTLATSGTTADRRVDIFAVSDKTKPVRVPPAAPTTAVSTVLKLIAYSTTAGTTVNLTPVTLTAQNTAYWTQWTAPATFTTGTQFSTVNKVWLQDDKGALFPCAVTDGIISPTASGPVALYTPATKTLVVKLASTIQDTSVTAPTFTLYANDMAPITATRSGSASGYTYTATNLAAAPSEVIAVSSLGAIETFQVAVAKK